MSIIKILPENLVNQIAAGEVIERPASVVKELVENSLDAKASIITIEVKDAGKTLIKITDNGIGISEEDLPLSLQRHATSKLEKEADLWNIKTMGFRGEALPSIASVSLLSIKSKQKDDLAGNEIICEGGQLMQIRKTGMAAGTVVEVRNLFFNTPAREKFLKKESTELSHISGLLNTIALANPEIAFKFIHNEKIIFDLPKSTDLISRVADIFGKATADAMIPVFYGGSDFNIDGYIGKPVISRSTSQHQYLFVNNRPIQHFIFSNTIKEAYHSLLMENKKPVFIVNFRIDPSLIDVNVHPRKLEIRFYDQQNIIKTLYNAVKTALDKHNLMPKGYTEAKHYISDSFPKSQYPVNDAISFTKNFLESREIKPLFKNDDYFENKKYQSISQIANSYIVAQNEDGLILIDQHAAHERIRYEELMDQFENENKSIQPLLMPFQIDFTADEISIFNENIQIFKNLGFDIVLENERTFLINEIPSFLAKEDLVNVVKGVLDDILNSKDPTKFQGNSENMIHYLACRSAVKFGQKLSTSEMEELIKRLDKLKRPYTCPHGRPTMISLTLDELEKMFGRK